MRLVGISEATCAIVNHYVTVGTHLYHPLTVIVLETTAQALLGETTETLIAEGHHRRHQIEAEV